MNTPSHPSSGEKTGNSAPVPASARPSVVVIPDALLTYANARNAAIVATGRASCLPVSTATAATSRQPAPTTAAESSAARHTAVPDAPSQLKRNTAAIARPVSGFTIAPSSPGTGTRIVTLSTSACTDFTPQLPTISVRTRNGAHAARAFPSGGAT